MANRRKFLVKKKSKSEKAEAVARDMENRRRAAARFREKMRAAGFVERVFWVPSDRVDEVRAFIGALN